MTMFWTCTCSKRTLAHVEFCAYCGGPRAAVEAIEAKKQAELVKAKHQQKATKDPNKPAPPPDDYWCI